jgi:hypothetical protein
MVRLQDQMLNFTEDSIMNLLRGRWRLRLCDEPTAEREFVQMVFKEKSKKIKGNPRKSKKIKENQMKSNEIK